MTWEVGKTYQMRGGGEFHVLEIDGPDARAIFGRARYPIGSDPSRWYGASRHCDGRAESDEDDASDIMPTTPPVVVSDAVAWVLGTGLNQYNRDRLATVITAWLTEHPHMLRAWQEGPK